MYYSKKPHQRDYVFTNIKKSLVPPPHCKACNMELLPYKDINGDVVVPEVFCDSICKNIYKIYEKVFVQSRTTSVFLYYNTYRVKEKTLPELDINV